MMTGQSSNTCAVDIFSLGCVFHYVMSRGVHPFGASYKRQGNILSAAHDTRYELFTLGAAIMMAEGRRGIDIITLSTISALGENFTCKSLVERMISHDARVRPSTVAVLKHPMFWSRQKVRILCEKILILVLPGPSGKGLLIYM